MHSELHIGYFFSASADTIISEGGLVKTLSLRGTLKAQSEAAKGRG